MQKFNEYIDYFRTIANTNVAIRDFALGGIEEILALERASLVYPCLWLEIPGLTPQWEAGRSNQLVWHGAFSIIVNAEVNDFDGKAAILHDTLNIVYGILGRIYRDWKTSKTTRLNPESIQIDALLSVATNNCHGWRVSFETACMIPICYNPADWTP